jgi:hypothetical protein
LLGLPGQISVNNLLQASVGPAVVKIIQTSVKTLSPAKPEDDPIL